MKLEIIQSESTKRIKEEKHTRRDRINLKPLMEKVDPVLDATSLSYCTTISQCNFCTYEIDSSVDYGPRFEGDFY